MTGPAIRFLPLTLLLLATGWFCPAVMAQVKTGVSPAVVADSALALQREGKLGEAADLYRLALAEAPRDNDIRTRFAQVLAWMGDYDSAIIQYREVLGADPKSYDARLGLALTYSWKNEYDASLSLLVPLCEDYPADTTVALAAARVSLWNGDTKGCLRYSGEVLSRFPGQSTALLLKALAQKREAHFRRAENTANELIRSDPGNIQAQGLLSELQDLYSLTASAYYYRESFSQSGRPANVIAAVHLDKQFGYNLVSFAEVESRSLFGSSDVAGMIGSTYKFSDDLSVYGDLLFGPATDAAQRFRGTLGITYRIFNPVSVDGSYQNMQFPSTAIDIFSPAVDYYFTSNTWLLMKAYFGVSRSTSSNSFLARMNFRPASSLYLQAGGFTGVDFYKQFSETYLQGIRASGGFLSAKYFFVRSWGVQLDAGYSKWSTGLKSYSGTLTVLYRR